ncbi:DNA polymerase III subunit beta [Erysipelothrix larvae]|uniref:Beta sliding clamp n=1 Tax=Erysipelothrix larvae TaxID=1514105 RepID=A0A109UGA1_9FIRM|nr:DNA polymerase III subunit beta [Erysipelothrix larvae]AMC92431.1 DNA polymerase III subunit beta [Erysipelothrix larvae]
MKFSISKSVFLKSLTSVGRASSNHSPLPILSGIKVTVDHQGITLLASNTNITIQEIIDVSEASQLSVAETGSVVLESRYLIEAVRKLDSTLVNVEIIDGALTRISGNNAEYEINGIKGDQFPAIDLTKPDIFFTLSAYKLKEIIKQTAFACSQSEDRPIFTGVNFRADQKTLECVATDSYRLAKKTIELDNPLTFNITVPATNLNEVEKTIDDNNDVGIALSTKYIQFYVGKTLIQSRLLDGMFPDVNRLIPTDFAYELSVDTTDFIAALDRSSFLKNDGYWTVRLETSSELITIRSRSQEIGSSHEVISPIDYKGGSLKITFSGRYMIEALRSFRADVVKILFVAEMQAFILVNPNDESVVQLVLPVRTFD